MILDSLKNSDQYDAIHPDFSKAFKFINENSETIPVGKYIIDGENLFVMIVETDLRKAEECKMEAHEKYIDIQVILNGTETFGWAELEECKYPKGDFDVEKDIIFYADKPTALVTAKDGQFVIFFPEDVHAPLMGEGKVRKAIFKVKVQKKSRK